MQPSASRLTFSPVLPSRTCSIIVSCRCEGLPAGTDPRGPYDSRGFAAVVVPRWCLEVRHLLGGLAVAATQHLDPGRGVQEPGQRDLAGRGALAAGDAREQVDDGAVVLERVGLEPGDRA